MALDILRLNHRQELKLRREEMERQAERDERHYQERMEQAERIRQAEREERQEQARHDERRHQETLAFIASLTSRNGQSPPLETGQQDGNPPEETNL